MRRRIGIGVTGAILAAGAWIFLMRPEVVAPRFAPERPTSAIGSGEDAVGVSASGVILGWQAPPKEGTVPTLPIDEPPEKGYLAGPLLQQARILGAAPPALLACVTDVSYGETGVVVELTPGVELYFGDASRAAEKWASGATVLADPSISTPDYVDLHVPSRPAYVEGGATLPSPEEAAGASCGD